MIQRTDPSRPPEHAPSERLLLAIEATRLSFGLTPIEVEALVGRATELGVRGVCVPAMLVPVAVSTLRRVGAKGLDVVTVANFPTGDHPLSLVQRMVAEAVAAGADHLDVVVPGGLVAQRNWRGVVDFLAAVRASAEASAARPTAMKVILETAAWDDDRLRGAANSALESGARWLKTSTGFHPAGGATTAVVRLLRRIAPPGVGIKASGGIRTRETALAMLDAGADRIGTSAEEAILGG